MLPHFEFHTKFCFLISSNPTFHAKHINIFSAGHLDKIKGHQDTISAMAMLPKEVLAKSRLFIAGRGNNGERSDLEQHIAHHKLGKHVVLLGQINNVQDWLDASDIFVLASHEEAFGMVFIEAGARAKPVVATDVGGIPDIIVDKKTGLLVAPRDPQALSKALQHLIENASLRETLATNAYERIASKFSIDNMISRYTMIFNQLVSR